MADRPILFSAPMVCALLAGRKTQTRRLFKPRGFEFYTHPVSGCRYDEYHPYRDGTWDKSRIVGSGSMQAFAWGEGLYAYLPYGPGDRLWVKETHTCVGDADRWTLYRASGYEAECDRHGFDKPYPPESEIKWNPSIFMRRALSRLTLTVTDVRVERLQDCSEADAWAEGLTRHPETEAAYVDLGELVLSADDPQSCYHLLWNHINGAGAWEANPWVVAVSFDVRKGNIDG
ncbi:hypothetical protein [Sphingobium agri]|uniref:Morphogenetic protein n=1 Tax=Sphingobium agri TaxID=2933566 RepID=A0ABT0DXD0_9SPHN|nr:hypothetical protein [Sphingobium agri]MCK0531755.1 hypothetical protein [Sphingobium agri]